MPFCNFSTMIYNFVQGNLYPCVCSSEACFPFVSLYCRSGKWGFAGEGGRGLQFRLFLLKSAQFLYPASSLSFRAYPVKSKQLEIECYTHRDILGGHIVITIQRFRSLIIWSIRVICVGHPLAFVLSDSSAMSIEVTQFVLVIPLTSS